MTTERNVGSGDLVTRIAASLIMAGLLVMTFPWSHTLYSLNKLGLLVAAELGLVCLMLGMFLRAKTYFAGAQLFLFPLMMLGLVNRGLPYVAVLLGAIILILGIKDIVTRKSSFNALLKVSTARAPNQATPSVS